VRLSTDEERRLVLIRLLRGSATHLKGLEELMAYARASLAEDATRFAVLLVALEALPRDKPGRLAGRDLCGALVQDHLRTNAPFHLDVTPSAEAKAAAEVARLLRRKVVFGDDLEKAVLSFYPAFREVEQRVTQVLENFRAHMRRHQEPSRRLSSGEGSGEQAARRLAWS
jgi:hypothetical protein